MIGKLHSGFSEFCERHWWSDYIYIYIYISGWGQTSLNISYIQAWSYMKCVWPGLSITGWPLESYVVPSWRTTTWKTCVHEWNPEISRVFCAIGCVKGKLDFWATCVLITEHYRNGLLLRRRGNHYIYIYIYIYIQISLNIIDILCLHIFFWIRSNSRITFIVFGGNWFMYCP